MTVKNNIVTKTGDSGITSLYSGERISKSDEIFDIIGNIDELISLTGVYKNKTEDKQNIFVLGKIQKYLFKLNTYIASTKNKDDKKFIKNLDFFDISCDNYYIQIKKLTGFVFPDHELDLCRCLCRKIERKLVGYQKKYKFKNFSYILKSINRLSDLYFFMARFSEDNRKYINLRDEE